MAFKKYVRTNVAEMRDIAMDESRDSLISGGVSISKPDMELPLEVFFEGKVARNPENHNDKWYVAKDYFDKNFRLLGI
jgi:hypothetical protein